MAETRTYNGYVYTRNTAGEPWVMAGPAQPAPSGRQATVVSNPFRARDEQRKDEDQELQRRADQRAADAERRADEASRRADAAEARSSQNDRDKQRTLDARGGVDTTEAERNAAFLATRLAGGLRDLSGIGNIGAPTLREALTGGTLLGNYFTNEDRQRAINAQREILDSALTLGTGAAYTQEQIDSYRAAYFPQPGDKPQTIADKSRRLQTALQAARLKAGASSGMIDQALGPIKPATSNPQVQTDARGVLQPDGTYERDGGLWSPEGKYLGLATTVTDDSPASPNQPSPATRGFQDSILNQGMSGINEGIAGTLGLPADMTGMALNLVPKAVNFLADTNLPEIQNPFLGGQWFKDRFSDVGSIRPETEDPTEQFVRRTAQSVGAGLVPAGGTVLGGGKAAAALLPALGGGIGAATAQQVFPNNPYAEIGGELLGSLGTGAGVLSAGRRSAQREIESAIPTVPQLKEQASGLYDAAEMSGAMASPSQTQVLADDVASILAREGTISPTGRISEVHPKVKEAYSLINDYASMPMSPTQMQTVRGIIGDAASSIEPKESRIASLLMDSFDDWADPLAPQLAQARAVASRYINAQRLEKARELAEARAGQYSQSGMENALRTEYRAIDRNMIKGKDRAPNMDLLDAITDVSRGTTGSNMARAVGKLAPAGPVSFGVGTVAPAGVATAMLGPVGGATTLAAMPAIGAAGKRLAENMTLRGADVAELIARNGGAIDQAPLIDPATQKVIAAMLAGQQGQYLDQ